MIMRDSPGQPEPAHGDPDADEDAEDRTDVLEYGIMAVFWVIGHWWQALLAVAIIIVLSSYYLQWWKASAIVLICLGLYALAEKRWHKKN